LVDGSANDRESNLVVAILLFSFLTRKRRAVFRIVEMIEEADERVVILVRRWKLPIGIRGSRFCCLMGSASGASIGPTARSPASWDGGRKPTRHDW
jgi:hypothetical protein